MEQCEEWWCAPVSSALEREGQEDHEFETIWGAEQVSDSLSYIKRHCLINK
jgi:hypothetical protein